VENKYTNFRNDDELKWIGIDLDGVLAQSIWPERGIGEPYEGTKENLWKLIDAGLTPILYTSRHWNDYENIKNWLEDNDLPIKKIICGKPLFKCTIDDRNLEGSLRECVNKLI
jgi:hypothetical protein